ncbi:MAG: DUF4388 domain-containing protein [Lentisphaerae bacterium]|nr:DUF4388 domain-containing protein [Lentisphaerota bacterium]
METQPTEINDHTLLWNRGKQLPKHAVPAMAASVVKLLGGLREQIVSDELPDQRTVEDVAGQLEAAGGELAECAFNCLAAAGGLRAATGKANGSVQSLSKLHAEHLRQHIGNDVVIARSKVSQLRWARVRLISVGRETAVVEHGTAYWETPVDQVIIVQDDVPEVTESTSVDSMPPSPILPDLATPSPTPAEAASFAHVGHGELSNVLQYLTFTGHAGRLDVEAKDCTTAGRVFIDKHRVVHAEFDGQQGLEALALLLRIDDGQARFYVDDSEGLETLTLPTDQLMLEAAVLADELACDSAS